MSTAPSYMRLATDAANGPRPTANDADAGEWIHIDVARQRSGYNGGHLRRKCLEDWQPRGWAQKRVPPEGGNAAWYVLSSADPLFARVKQPEQLPFDTSLLPPDREREVKLRARIVTGWRDWLESRQPGTPELAATQQYLEFVHATLREQLAALKMRVERKTLYNWHNAYRARGLAGLVKGTWKAAKPADQDGGAGGAEGQWAEFFAELRHWYLHENQRSITVCYRMASARAHAQGWAVPGYHTAGRHLRALPKPALTLARKGGKAFDDKHGAHFERDYTSYRVNEVWVGDHHPCDAIVHYKGKLIRPWLSAFMDMRSRRLFYTFTPGDPDSDTIIEALFNGIEATGLCVPETVFVDNGKDYDCYALQGVTKLQRFGMTRLRVQVDPARYGGILGKLKIGIEHARPFNPKSKPVERYFRSYSEGFDKLLDTYCGNKPETKPPSLAAKLEKFPAPGHVVMSFEDYAAAGSRWIEEEYHRRPHAGHGMDGRSPLEVYEQLLAESTKRTTTPQILALCKLKPGRPVKVGRTGVRHNGLTYGAHEEKLWAIQGQTVQVRTDPADVTRVSVWTTDGAFVCHATANRRVPRGMSKAEWSAGQGAANRKKRAAKVAGVNPMHVAADPLDLVVEHRAQENARRAAAGETPTPPPTGPGGLKIIQTGFEGQTEAFARSKAPPALKVVGGPEIDLLADDGDDVAPLPLAAPPTSSLLDDLGGDA